ncbi:hypothetical protein EIN_425420 [Entamoeba invadens IP1]|uniref:Ubiquitin carboxyl-terminal hydrolase n=1 Tax=Entamoeba invadens IP1 TaxID=370355 RepID=A0A0A1U654_ENTIV|nr:hypothetical protein EIN_425420 [Entamoeba invadens IP1]ELP89810.1 hypothetical protein EIN_425420 [Entamoeba invadens IP1]|eukprot:XP_004256581.1 hypothetical protein EIN_425420 [Entamoeba invadens IP1]
MSRYLRRILKNDEHTRSPGITETGLCGLFNLGNSCYVNSVVQCLAHCDIIQSTSFQVPTPFTKSQKPGDSSLYDNNISLAFFSTVKSMCSTDFSIVTPKAIKDLLGMKYDQFKGHKQQDAQELLIILLDELNLGMFVFLPFCEITEGLNSSLSPPLTEMISHHPYKFLPSSQPAADEIWNRWQNENNSIITHSFCGQQLQRVTCTVCGYHSDSFDPFNCLSMTIPSISRQRGFVTVCVIGSMGPPIYLKILLNASPDVLEIQQRIEKELKKEKDESIRSIDAKHLICSVVQKGKPWKFRPTSHGILSLVNYEKIFAFVDPFLCYDIKEGEEKKDTIAVIIQIRVVKGPHVCVLHNDPIVISVPSTCTGEELINMVHARMSWCGQRGVVKIVNDEFKACGLCGEKIECDGCMARDVMYATDLLYEPKKSKFFSIYLSYDVPDNSENDKMRCCDSFEIGMTQRLKTTAVSLFACLTLFTHGDSFEMIEWKCEKCGKNVAGEVDVTIWRPPKVLIFHLKRFEFTEKFERIKTFERVVFPNTNFDLREYVSNPDWKDPVLYNLFAVVNHDGEIDKGHYSADCKVGEEWYTFSDEKVTPLPAAPSGSDNAYILFYRLVE